ncbi:MAG: S-layer homology domain-containing protein [Clostridiales bacterium]|nr:S-layer homology domain-containing protein [Clostridiales bacterium]
MKKRILSMMLAPILLFSMAVPGFAAESSDSAARLAAVTGKVKSTLALDTERYKEFGGQLTEGELAPTWRLSWSGEDGSLEITAAESGRILSYYRYDNDETWDSAPLSLPKSDPAEAKDAAAAFLKRVLGSTETVDLDAAADKTTSLHQTRYYFRGTIQLNGCPSPLSFSLSVRASDYAVVQFRRDSLETGYIGTVPAASFQMKQSAVEPLLRDTLSLRLEYVLDAGQKTAVLRYLPNSIHNFYVDDASGKLVDLTKLYEELGRDDKLTSADAAAEAPSPAAGAESNGGLTQAEQLGADKLKGTLSKEALDQKAKAISELGLGSYTLASVSYQEEELVKDAPVIIARLSYAKRVDERTLYRWVTLNAKTGELIAVYSSRLWEETETKKVDEDAARKTAEAFLTAQQKEHFALCAPYTGDPANQRENGRYGVWSFQYARQENGYFFPSDQFVIEIDVIDGSVSSYSQSWTEDVRFDSPDGIISAEQAVNAYFKTFQTTKGYVAVPQKLDLSDPDYAPLAEMGYRALNSLKLGWQLTASGTYVTGIDAKTGQPVSQAVEESTSIQYSDLAGSQAKNAAEKLAEYGIGYAGGKFCPNQKLTQLDFVALLASTQGVLIDPDNLADGDADRAYWAAYNMGALQRADRDDSRILSRIDVIKILLDAGGYGTAARLQGIYRTDFSDQADIPDSLLGYAALAQALNVAKGDTARRLNPNQSATHGDAAIMLLAFMQRD